jgi:acyl carrier protein
MADMNDRTETETAVLDTLADVLDESAGDLRAQPVLAAHEWDSQASLEVLSQLERRLDITLDLRTYHGARTIEDLIDIVVAAGSKPAVGQH